MILHLRRIRTGLILLLTLSCLNASANPSDTPGDPIGNATGSTVWNAAPDGSTDQAASPVRFPGETYSQALHRALPWLSYFSDLNNDSEVSRDTAPAVTPSPDATAIDLQAPFAQIDLTQIPQVGSLAVAQEMFKRIRDLRSWHWDEMADFPRRLPWLYPADGCYLRADMMVREFHHWKYPTPAKLFIFGNLTFSNEFETISWWYHVAPVVRVGNTPYIIDPSVDPYGPLTAQEWALKITPSLNETNFSVCTPGTVHAEDVCHATEPQWDREERHEELQEYLALEWQQLESILNASPMDMLGEHPPWMR